jgi:hypothetical protein
MNRRVRHDKAALSHHRHEVPIAQPVGDVLANAQFNDLGIEAAPSVDGISGNRPGHLGFSSVPELYNCTAMPLHATEPSNLGKKEKG